MGRLKDRSIRRTEDNRQAARLGDIADAGLAIFCWCNRCGHNSSVDSRMLAAKIGTALPVPEIGARMRCTGCQSKDIATRPVWPSPPGPHAAKWCDDAPGSGAGAYSHSMVPGGLEVTS